MITIDLSDRVALVTGSAQGLGLGMAEALAEAGAKVAISDVQDDVGSKAAEKLSGSGATAIFVSHDVTSEESWESAVSTCVDELGGLDILVNNAGIEISSLVIEANRDDLMRMLEVNVVGTALGLKHGLRAMGPDGAAGRGGSIINLSSVSAAIGFPGVSGYAATKAAVERLTKVAAVEAGKLGLGVRVNAVYPGFIGTEMGTKLAQDTVDMGLFESVDAALGVVLEMSPVGRVGEVEDIANAVVWLASDASAYVTGTGIFSDGGMSI